jgi:sulfatase modifying factor 1
MTDSVTRALIVELESDGIRRQWQPAQVGNATFMGGFYSTSGEHGPGCLFTTIAHEAAYHDYSTGFRCCKDASHERPRAPDEPQASSDAALSDE